jgi:hypothetical protein
VEEKTIENNHIYCNEYIPYSPHFPVQLFQSTAVINLIANTKTETGLTVRYVEDKKLYKKGIKINDNELKKFDLKPATFLGNWNYSIKSKNK